MTDLIPEVLACGHCNNISHMKIFDRAADTITYTEPPYEYEKGTLYHLLKCPACDKITIISFEWAEYREDDEDYLPSHEILYPQPTGFPVGLPDKILNTYKAAEKIKSIDVNAYVILLRRLLELVCFDRKAKGETLAQMLADLAIKGEIPDKLVKVAKGLRDFGNMGAHVGAGELSNQEIPIAKALCTAILEYIYSAPYLADVAESKLTSIKSKSKKGS